MLEVNAHVALFRGAAKRRDKRNQPIGVEVSLTPICFTAQQGRAPLRDTPVVTSAVSDTPHTPHWCVISRHQHAITPGQTMPSIMTSRQRSYTQPQNDAMLHFASAAQSRRPQHTTSLTSAIEKYVNAAIHTIQPGRACRAVAIFDRRRLVCRCNTGD